uniref:ATP synthase F0 subunit 8 n=1 Tax=Antonbruunia milenae TaxID=3053535 RepID=UPI0030E3005D
MSQLSPLFWSLVFYFPLGFMLSIFVIFWWHQVPMFNSGFMNVKSNFICWRW